MFIALLILFNAEYKGAQLYSSFYNEAIKEIHSTCLLFNA